MENSASSHRIPVLFASHGSPFDIGVPREEHPYWMAVYHLGKELRKRYPIRGVLVVSAHWCTRGVRVDSSLNPKQIFDYYGFPERCYTPRYTAKGSPEIAARVAELLPGALPEERGLDHGAWPLLMHLVPDADIPVLQLSLSLQASPEEHYDMGRKLRVLRDEGVLLVGSGSLIHNLGVAFQKIERGDMSPAGWEAPYDSWLKARLDEQDLPSLLSYPTSHPSGKLAAPTPEHFVPLFYTLGAMEEGESLSYFYEKPSKLPAFSERSFTGGFTMSAG